MDQRPKDASPQSLSSISVKLHAWIPDRAGLTPPRLLQAPSTPRLAANVQICHRNDDASVIDDRPTGFSMTARVNAGASAPPAGAKSLVGYAAGALIKMSLAVEEGDYLGAEPELMTQLGVSRPTLRQAAKVVQNDRLIEVRRGAEGGFYAARPSARDAIQGPALWLKLLSATLREMNAASRLIFPQAAWQAAACTDPGLIDEMRALREDLEIRRPGEKRADETVETDVRLNDLIGRMTGDPVMQLFMAISCSFGLIERRPNLYGGETARRVFWLELQRRLCDAILAGDGELAARIGDDRGTAVAEWIEAARENRGAMYSLASSAS